MSKSSLPIQTWRYSIPSVQHEGWAIAHLDSGGFFAVISDFGSYAYHWRDWGTGDFREFLIATDAEYLCGKFGTRSTFDPAGTTQLVREQILEYRRDGTLDWPTARRLWAHAANVPYDPDLDELRAYLDHLDPLPIDDPPLVYDFSPQLRRFMERVWPRLVSAMQVDLEREATRPSIAERLEVLSPQTREAVDAAVATLYFTDSSDYKPALWSVIRILLDLDFDEVNSFDLDHWAHVLNPEWEAEEHDTTSS